MVHATDARGKAAEQRLGRVLKEKWRLDALLGVGGMAAVYAATHRNGKRVAVKMLHREYSTDAELRARFLREGYLVNQVGHPGVVGVLDDEVAEDQSVFLVMDLLEGESLEARRVRKGGKLDPGEVLSVADQVLDVLVVAHGKDLVHRDLKPENLFLCRDGSVKLLDFGIARLQELSRRLGATQVGGTTMGTPAFMPPEQARGAWKNVDARTDLWALGASMFTLLTGTIVHGSAPTVADLLVLAMTKPAPPLASRFPGVDAGLALVVDRALQHAREDRWQDARSMQTAVRDAYHRVEGSPVSTAPKLVVPELPRAASAPAPFPAATQGRVMAPSDDPASVTTPRIDHPKASPLVLLAAGAGLALVLCVTGVVIVAAFRGSRGDTPDTPPEPDAGAPFAKAPSPSPSDPLPLDPSVVVTPGPPSAEPEASSRPSTSPREPASPSKRGGSAKPQRPIDPLDRRR